MSGWIRIERSLWDHPLFPPEPMSEREAWAWMLANAAWESTKHRVGGELYDVPRGSFMTTLRELQSVFMWRSDTRVRNFLKRLEAEAMIERTTVGSKNAPKTHVTICKYDQYQSPERTENAPKTHRERAKNAVKEQENNKPVLSLVANDPCPFDAFNEIAERSGWPKVQTRSRDRISAVGARMRECGGFDNWLAAMERAANSNFLSGRATGSTPATFDWLNKPTNFRKLMEGNYDDRQARGNPQPGGWGGNAQAEADIFAAAARNRRPTRSNRF